MNPDTKHFLARLQTLEKEGSIQRMNSMARALWVIGLALCLFVVYAVSSKIHPTFVAIAAAAMGWVVAECNALRTRCAQWPIFRSYIDWKKVEEDLRVEMH